MSKNRESLDINKDSLKEKGEAIIGYIKHQKKEGLSEEQKIEKENRQQEFKQMIDKAATSKINPLRTYQSDAEDAMHQNKTTKLDIALAEKKKEGKTPEILAKKSNGFAKRWGGLFVMLSIAFIALGGAIFFGAHRAVLSIFSNDRGQQTNGTVERKSIMRADNYHELAYVEADRFEIASLLREEFSQTIPQNTIREIYFTRQLEDEKETLGGEDFARLLRSDNDPLFFQALGKEWMTGFYSDGENNWPFIIFKTDSYEETFSSMLKWEASLMSDLSIFGYTQSSRQESLPMEIILPSTAGEGEDNFDPAIEEIIAQMNQRGVPESNFRDIIIQNRDVRALTDGNRNIFIAYSFFDRRTLIITASEKAFEEIFLRLTANLSLR